MKTCQKCDDQHDRGGLCDCGRGPENEKTGCKKHKSKKPYVVEWRSLKEYNCSFIFGFEKWTPWRRYKKLIHAESAVKALNKNNYHDMWEYRLRED